MWRRRSRKCISSSTGQRSCDRLCARTAVHWGRVLPLGWLFVSSWCWRAQKAYSQHDGRTYTRAVVLPLYLFDFTVNRKSDDLMTAMRRGWIQQEISYGVLHRTTTEHFIKTCIKSESFGELATFLRRRPKAMKWFVKAWKNDKSEDTSEDTVKIRSIQEMDGADLNDLSTYTELMMAVQEMYCL